MLLGAPDGAITRVLGDVSTPAAAHELSEHIRTHHPDLRTIVASLGSWTQGPQLMQLDYEVWKRASAAVDLHFFAARALMPLIASRDGASSCSSMARPPWNL